MGQDDVDGAVDEAEVWTEDGTRQAAHKARTKAGAWLPAAVGGSPTVGGGSQEREGLVPWCWSLRSNERRATDRLELWS